ncbi:MAG: AmmeMemoRadiSam system protein B [Dehalococcoidia bacterium]
MVEGAGIRKPAVAGQFYAASPEALRRQLLGCYTHPLGPGGPPQVNPATLGTVVGLVVPHAGYTYSGPVAAHAFARLAQRGTPQTVVILGPNHYGLGKPLALSPHGSWETPLGTVEVDGALGEALAFRLPSLASSEAAHRQEHALEVEVPFLQHLYGCVNILPIAMLDQGVETSVELGRALAKVLSPGSVVLASTDLSHYYPQGTARELDRRAIEAILSLDPSSLHDVIEKAGINMCGPGPVAAMLECLRRLGAGEARLLAYATSGDTSGKLSQVVGYVAVEVS